MLQNGLILKYLRMSWVAFYGAAYPLLSGDIDPARAVAIREDVAGMELGSDGIGVRSCNTTLS